MYNKYRTDPEFENFFQQESGYELLPEFEMSGPPPNVSRRSVAYMKWVQTKLNQSLNLRLTVDGKMGSQTRSAIRSFQRNSGLTADGMVGPRTEQALKNVVEKYASSSNTSANPNTTEQIVKGSIHRKIWAGAVRIQSPGTMQSEVSPAGPAVAAATLGYTILKDILNNSGDISWNLQKLDGIKSPFDDPRYQTAGTWVHRTIPIKQRVNYIWGSERMSATFELRYWTNGYAIGNVSIVNTNTNDALGWGLFVSGEIMPRPGAYIVDGVQPIAAIDVTFIYRFNRPLVNDDIYKLEITLYGNGRIDQNGRWTQ